MLALLAALVVSQPVATCGPGRICNVGELDLAPWRLSQLSDGGLTPACTGPRVGGLAYWNGAGSATDAGVYVCHISGPWLKVSAASGASAAVTDVTATGAVTASPTTGSVVVSYALRSDPAYQTTGNVTLYVDKAGNDSNACTAANDAGCLTFSGAMGKLPALIRHAVVINIDAGTYNEAPRILGFEVQEASTTATAASLTVNGTLVAPTISTGTASGTFTAWAPRSGATLPTATDAAQTWTADELRGALVLMTSGGQSGQYHQVVTNTATTLTLATDFSSTVSGATYNLLRPGTVFTGGQFLIRGNTGAGLVTVNNVHINNTSTAAIGFNTNTRVTMQRSRATTTSALLLSGVGYAQRTLIFTSMYFDSANTGAAISVNLGGQTQFNDIYFRDTSTGSVFFQSITEAPFLSGYFESQGTADGVINYYGGAITNTQWTAPQVRCLTPGSGTGLYVHAPRESGVGTTGVLGITNFAAVDCNTGVLNDSPMELVLLGSTFSNNVVAVTVDNGGLVNFRLTTPTFTSVTTQLSLNGEGLGAGPTAYTFAQLVGLSPAIIRSLSTGAAFESR